MVGTTAGVRLTARRGGRLTTRGSTSIGVWVSMACMAGTTHSGVGAIHIRHSTTGLILGHIRAVLRTIRTTISCIAIRVQRLHHHAAAPMVRLRSEGAALFAQRAATAVHQPLHRDAMMLRCAQVVARHVRAAAQRPTATAARTTARRAAMAAASRVVATAEVSRAVVTAAASRVVIRAADNRSAQSV